MSDTLFEKVYVQARTHARQLEPILVIWKGERFPVTKVLKRSKEKTGRKLETMEVNVMVIRKMELEFDPKSKEWRLLRYE